MSEIIEDGKGRGYSAGVDSLNRLAVYGVSETNEVFAAFEGDYYNVNTGTINVTSGNASGLLYIKNTGSSKIIITSLFYILGNSTGGSGDVVVDVYRNPTGGTLISGGTTVSEINRDFNSNNTMSATILKGAEGSTLTGGDVIISSILTGNGRVAIPTGALILSNGNSLAIKLTPQSGNTSQNVQMAFACYTEQTRF